MQRVSLIIIGLTLFFTQLPAMAQQSLSFEGELEELRTLFFKLDKNADTVVSRAEFDTFYEKAFDELDADNSGFLIEQECDEECIGAVYFGQQKDHEFARAPYHFSLADMDRNGRVTKQEYVSFGRDRFFAADFNEDGFLNQDEFCSSFTISPCRQ